VISRHAILGSGLLIVGLVSAAVVVPLWYLASYRRGLFDFLCFAFVVAAAIHFVVSRRVRARRVRGMKRGEGTP